MPCVVAYHVELAWKQAFVEQESSRQRQAAAGRRAAATRTMHVSLTYATYDVICLSLMICEAVVRAAPPLQCECTAVR